MNGIVCKSFAKNGIIATLIPVIKWVNMWWFTWHEPDLVLPCSLDSRVVLDWLSFAKKSTTLGNLVFRYFAFIWYMGHSMSSDLAKLGFFIWPSSKFTKLHKEKDLSLLSSTMLEFFKSNLYFLNYEHLKFWCFSRILDRKNFGILMLKLQLIVSFLHLRIFSFDILQKVKVPCWTKTRQNVFHWWPLKPGKSLL